MLNKAIISLSNIRHNALNIRSKLNKNVKFCAVVKADAYGHGGPVVASMLYKIVDFFAVAIVEEGIELRISGIDKDILVFTIVDAKDIERAIDFDLTLTVSSYTQYVLVEKIANFKRKRAKIHLKINTGMNRQGIDCLCELEKIFIRNKKQKLAVIEGIYSHFGCPESKKKVKSALDKFSLAISLSKGYNKDIIKHISASGGFIQGIQLDMVRIGILLYGYAPFENDYIKVKPAMKVLAPIIARRTLQSGDTIMYGKEKLKENVSVDLIRYGYADGLFRCKIDGQKNNRCMDITACLSSKVKNGYINVLENVNKLSYLYKTIPYEILVKSASRAEKIYED